jgi:hypothetical protein
MHEKEKGKINPQYLFLKHRALSFTSKNLSAAYTFWIGAFLFGLPLLSSLYFVQYSEYSLIKYLIPYCLISLTIGVVLLSRGNRKTAFSEKDNATQPSAEKEILSSESFRLAYIALFFATLGLVSYWLMKYFVDVAYPSPNSYAAGIAALVYLVSIALAAATGIPFLLLRLFPVLRSAVDFDKRYATLAVLVGVSYLFTYLIVVNQVIITGFNTPPGNYVPSPSGSYPFAFVFTAGPPPDSLVASAIYVPQVLLQLNQYFNLVVLPFEVLLGVVLSAFVAATVIITLYLIKDSSRHSCLTGATVSGLGGFFGFTATCPTCLVPTLISVLFGGVSSTVPSLYSHLAGVILPPLLSIASLSVGLTILDYQATKGGHTLKSLVTMISSKISIT